ARRARGDRPHPDGLRPADPGGAGHGRGAGCRLESRGGIPTECGPRHSGPTRAMTTEPTPDRAAEAPADETSQDEVIESLRAELEQVRAQSLLDRADLENQRRPMERDVQNACRFANKQLLGDLLPVFDSLDAALVAAGDSGPMREGVELTLRELR